MNSAARSLLVCPRISPEWELAAQLALVKPKPYTRDKIAHGSSRQRMPRNGRKIVDSWAEATSLTVEYFRRGELYFSVALPDAGRGKHLARKLSRLLPTLWFIHDGELLRDGVFYARTGRYKLELVRANRVRLRRSVRYGFLGDVDHALAAARVRAGQNTATQ